ncbi:MAG: dienelactone hydrolase family protein [Gemmatimonadota bacterium]|nr:dienelactone hydrolase family protein [Gemmatimonadota bacterium]
MSELTARHIPVTRTARYYQIGSPNPLVRDVWIACHGFSQLAADFAVPFQSLEDDTRVIVVPEALSRFYLDTRPGHSAGSKVGATWLTREDRHAEIADMVGYLDAVYERILDELAAHGVHRERSRVHALGFSQGGPAVARWAASGTAVIDRLVSWAHAIPQDVNLRALGERRPRLAIDVVYGTRDRFIGEDAIEEERAMLEASGIPFRMHPFPGGHTLNVATIRKLMAE